jgi:hypothetical protein
MELKFHVRRLKSTQKTWVRKSTLEIVDERVGEAKGADDRNGNSRLPGYVWRIKSEMEAAWY